MIKYKKDDFTGTGKVFAFTVSQFLRSKANIVSFAVLMIIILLSIPVATLASGGETVDSDTLETVLYYNETPVEVNFTHIREKADRIFEAQSLIGDITLTPAQTAPAELGRDLNGSEAFVYIHADEAGAYVASVYSGGDSAHAVSQLSEITAELLEEGRLSAAGATREQLDIIMKGQSSDYMTVSAYKDKSALNYETLYIVEYAYSIVVFILTLLSISYIIRTVIEEKASKVVETLLISVKPLALILGKIFAVMLYIFGMLSCMVVGVVISYFVTSQILDTSAVMSMITESGFSFDLLNISPFTVVIVLVSMVLGYFTFSVMAAISGTSCSTIEDVDSASTSSIIIVFACYMTSAVVVPLSGSTVSAVFSLIPFVSVFTAPASYVCGNISLTLLIISWLIQAVVVFLLARFCAKIYSDLIVYRGRRLKLGDLLNMSKNGSKDEKRKNAVKKA